MPSQGGGSSLRSLTFHNQGLFTHIWMDETLRIRCGRQRRIPWHLLFFYHSTSFTSPTAKSHWTMLVDNVGLKTCLLGASNFIVTLTFLLGVNWNGRGTRSTTNHIFHMALWQLHGPWCKQPLRLPWQIGCLFTHSNYLGLTWHPKNL